MKPKKKSGSGIKIKRMAERIFNVLKSFKVKELMLDIDTEDYIWNAYLHPAFYFLSGKNRMLRVNYVGRISARIIVHNRLISILYAFIK